MSGSAGHQDDWKPSHNPWLIAVTVTLAAFMEVLDTTIVNVALPHIAGSLGSSYDDATWALTSYLVANGIVLTISGWLSRLFGRKRYFLICIFMFTVMSFLCGLATSLPMLVVFRLLQGFFGGGLQPSQQSIILDTFPPEKRGAAFALTAIATIVGPVLGPMLGGYLTDNMTWRWIFFVNVPFGILTVIAVAALVEDPPWEKRRREAIDVVGIALISLGLGCLEVMCDRGQDDDWFGSPFIVTMAVLGVIGILGSIAWLIYAKNPLLRLTVLKDRNFATGMLLISMVGATLYASAIVVPQFAQQVLGYTATNAGLLLAPGGVVVICLIPIVGMMAKRVQLRYLIAFGFFAMGSAMFFSSNLYGDIDFRHLMLFRICQTGALAFLFVPISTITYATLPRSLNSDGSALFSMARNYVGSLAISLASAALFHFKQRQQNYQADHMIASRPEVSNYISHVQAVAEAHGMSAMRAHTYAIARLHTEFTTQVAMLGYNEVFGWIGVIAFSVVPFCFLLTNNGKTSGVSAGVH